MIFMHFQWPEDDIFIQRITRECLPMIKCRQTKCLPYCMHSQISLKSNGFNARDQCLNDVMWSSRLRCVILDCPSPFCKHCEDCFNALWWCALDLSVIDWLHQSGICSQECGIEASPGSWDHLSWRVIWWIFGYLCIYESEFDIAHRLVAERPFPCAPFESLNDTLLNLI